MYAILPLESPFMKNPLFVIRSTKITFFIVSAIAGALLQSPGLICIAIGLLFLLTLENRLDVKIPSGIATVFILFIILSLFLGSYHNFYERFPWWDDALHIFYGAGFALIGFIIIEFLSKKRRIQNDILVICLFSFCFSVAFGAIWEIYEFMYDTWLGGNMQRTDQGSGVSDTMNDIILESFAALAVNIYIYIYVRTGARNWISNVSNEFITLNARR